jgi:hypothetical protein
MSVQFILDYFHIDNEAAIEVQANEEDVTLQTQRIFQHLREQSVELLRVRLTSEVLYQRFRDFEGWENVLPTKHKIPRLLFAEKLTMALPDWLSNEQIVSLNLLKSPSFEPRFNSFEENLLAACHLNLISGNNFGEFIQALSQQTSAFLNLLDDKTIQNYVLNHIEFDLNIERENGLLLLQILKNVDLATFVERFAYQQHLFYLRQFASRYALDLAFPPLEFPAALLSLPRLALLENQAGVLIEKWIAVLHSLKHKMLSDDISANVLADLVIVDWSALWTELNDTLDANPTLISETLAQKIATFGSQKAILLAEKLKQGSYPLLTSAASVAEVLAWSEGYFEYCRHAFLYKQKLDETINGSFTDYLLSQSARISLSASSWHYCHQKITEFLQAEYLVIVIMVDALSALNQNLLLAEFESLSEQEQLILDSKMLFAPLPTTTEIGKKAVLTGKPANQFTGDYEKALRETYQPFLPADASLKIIQSYKESSEHLSEYTNLLVYFENKLDARLHDCISFEKHQDDIKLICSQLKTSIRRWTKDAISLGRDVVFFITADHGMTVTQELYSGETLGETSERFFKLKSSQPEIPSDFVKFENYAIPKKRLRLTADGLLTHGGLTPEEVLIPFVTLTTKTPEPTKASINITLKSSQARRIGDKKWQIELSLMANRNVRDIRIKPNGIFQGEASIDSLRANKNQEIILSFSTSNEQDGLTEMELTILYSDYVVNTKANEKILKTIAIEFPPALLEKDSGTQNFEGMF